MLNGDLGSLTSGWCNHRWWQADTLTGGSSRTPFRLWYLAAGRIDVETSTALEVYQGGQWVSAPRAFIAQKMYAGTELMSLALEWRLADGTSPLMRIPDGALSLGRHGGELRKLLLAQCQLQAKRSSFPTGEMHPALADLTLAYAGLWHLAGMLISIFPDRKSADQVEEPSDARVLLAMRTLRQRLRSQFPQERLEQLTGLGRRRLEQLFLAKVGLSPRAYHARLRMEEARMLVVQGRLQVKEIASTLAFASAAAFTQAFIRCYGMSPSACQAEARA